MKIFLILVSGDSKAAECECDHIEVPLSACRVKKESLEVARSAISSKSSKSSSHSYTSKLSSNSYKSDSDNKPLQSCKNEKLNSAQIIKSPDIKSKSNSPSAKVSSRLEETRVKPLKPSKCEMVLTSPCPRK